MGEVKVFGWWPSYYSKRVEIALKIKGVEYEHVEIIDPYVNKSPELLRYNPIHKKIPVLVPAGKPVAESLVILEYIDETWKSNPLLPTDPYERAQARFWANLFDDKLMPAVRSVLYSKSQGGERKKLEEEAKEALEALENELKGKKDTLFGGERVGFMDIVGIATAQWLPALEEAAGSKVLTKETYPSICAWSERLLACSVIRETLNPKDKHKLIPFFQARLAAMHAN